MNAMKVNPGISNVAKTLNTQNVKKTDDKESFGNMLSQSIKEVDQAHKSADKMISGLASGEKVDIHNTMIAMEKADISFQLMMQVRNKLVSAYQEIYRMQV